MVLEKIFKFRYFQSDAKMIDKHWRRKQLMVWGAKVIVDSTINVLLNTLIANYWGGIAPWPPFPTLTYVCGQVLISTLYFCD